MAGRSSVPRQDPSLKLVAILGRRDFPTDGVVDYCSFLREALGRQGVPLEMYSVPWVQKGWAFALYGLWKQSKKWRGRWAVLQYTALSWSKRGFPFVTLAVLWILRMRGVRCAVVFHDAFIHPSDRLVNRVRDRIQNWIMARLFQYSDQPVLTAPAATLCWIPRGRGRASFIPIGANIPEINQPRTFTPTDSPKVISIFSVTGGEAQAQEVKDIIQAVTHATNCIGPIRLEVFGRGSTEAHELLECGFTGLNVDLRVYGVIGAPEISRIISGSHAVLNVRGLTTSRRGTSIAGIACGIPVVGYGYPGTDPPIDAAGVLLAPWRNPQYLGNLLVQLLREPALWNESHQRSRAAQAEYFSWDAVARRYREALTRPISLRAQPNKHRVLFLRDHPTASHAAIFRRKSQHPKLDILVAYRRLTVDGGRDGSSRGARGAAGGNDDVHSTGNGSLLRGYPWILIPANGIAPITSSRAALKLPALRRLIRGGTFDAIYVNDGAVASNWNIILRGKDAPIIVPALARRANRSAKSKVTNAGAPNVAADPENLEKNVESFVDTVESAISTARSSTN